MYAILVAALTALYVLGWHWWKVRQRRTSANWPVADGYVAQVEEKRDDNGLLIVTLAYTYKVADERYVGRESFPFVRDRDAARFEAGCKERSVRVHYRPDKPSVSALARESTPSQLSYQRRTQYRNCMSEIGKRIGAIVIFALNHDSSRFPRRVCYCVDDPGMIQG